MIIIRNRLISLLARIVGFVGLVIALSFYFSSIPDAWRAVCYFDIEVYFVYLIVLGAEIIANLIDMRHGIRGIPAGVFMPISLAVTSYGIMASILYFTYMIPVFGNGGLQSLICHSVFFIMILLDYIAFDEKGTVHTYSGFVSLLYIIFYVIFSWIRVVIWPNDPLILDSNYFFKFLDASSTQFGLWTLLSFVISLVFFLFMVFMNKALGGRFSKRSRSF